MTGRSLLRTHHVRTRDDNKVPLESRDASPLCLIYLDGHTVLTSAPTSRCANVTRVCVSRPAAKGKTLLVFVTFFMSRLNSVTRECRIERD